MEGLSSWLKQIVAVVLLAGLVDLLLPNRTMQRYVRLVAGLFILLAVASPILRWIQGDFGSRLAEELDDAVVQAQTASASGELARIEEEGRKWRQRQQEEAANLAAARLEEAIRQDVEQSEGRKVEEVRVEMDRQADGTLDVKEVTVHLGEPSVAASGEAEMQPVERMRPVEPVTVRGAGETSRPAAAEQSDRAADPQTANRISAWIAARYGVPADRVAVVTGDPDDTDGR